MLSFLPELPATPGLPMPGSGPALPAAGSAASADFAGLLEAALPPGEAVAAGAAPPEPPLPAAASLLPAQMPTGKGLPPPGATLPVVVADMAVIAGPGEQTLPTATPVSLPRDGGMMLARPQRAAVSLADGPGEAAAPRPVTATDSADDDTAQTHPADATADHHPPLAPAIAAAPIIAQPRPSAPDTAPLDDDATPAPTDDPAPAAAALVLANAPKPLSPAPAFSARSLPLVRGGIAPLPARTMLPASAPESAPASPIPVENSAAPGPATITPAEGLPETPAQPSPQAAPPPAAPQLATVSTAAPQSALTTTPTESTLAPQLEQTIAQADTLREALRAARPEMTLRHAEFGAVSLRLEATGSESWRAVLAARDPGFVPAIQAALAERAIAPATPADAADTGGGFLSQNGTSDQRYGASPNGGQGGHSPHLGQSGTRDGEAAPDHRRPSTAATLAGRDQREAGEDGSGSGSARQSRGLFA